MKGLLVGFSSNTFSFPDKKTGQPVEMTKAYVHYVAIREADQLRPGEIKGGHEVKSVECKSSALASAQSVLARYGPMFALCSFDSEVTGKAEKTKEVCVACDFLGEAKQFEFGTWGVRRAQSVPPPSINNGAAQPSGQVVRA